MLKVSVYLVIGKYLDLASNTLYLYQIVNKSDNYLWIYIYYISKDSVIFNQSQEGVKLQYQFFSADTAAAIIKPYYHPTFYSVI